VTRPVHIYNTDEVTILGSIINNCLSYSTPYPANRKYEVHQDCHLFLCLAPISRSSRLLHRVHFRQNTRLQDKSALTFHILRLFDQ
jgi:hypothetical protein